LNSFSSSPSILNLSIKKTAVSVLETAVLFIVLSCSFESYRLIEISIVVFMFFSLKNTQFLTLPSSSLLQNGRISTKNELKKRAAKTSQTLDFTEQFGIISKLLCFFGCRGGI